MQAPAQYQNPIQILFPFYVRYWDIYSPFILPDTSHRRCIYLFGSHQSLYNLVNCVILTPVFLVFTLTFGVFYSKIIPLFMKKSLLAGLVLVFLSVAFLACNNDKTSVAKPTDTAAAAKYICPMNCEKGKTYDKPGACPVCHMDLEPIKAEEVANTNEYFTAFASNPVQLEVGKPGLLSFTPKIKGNETIQVPLDLVHEKKVHLILVSDDLSWFDHLHPEYQASGAYEAKVLAKGQNYTIGRGHGETRFESGGKFLAFTDYKPVGGLNQVNKTEIQVAGAPSKSQSYTAAKMTTEVDGLTVTFDAHGEALTTVAHTHMHIDIMDNGKRLTPDQIENYLGAKAHIIMVETTTKEFLHIHPEAAGDELEMNTTFAKPGTYRGWLQFQTKGKLHTADFVMVVAQGSTDTQKNPQKAPHTHGHQ
jgi:Heavy metal binding domain